ncbi:MAG: InlB B-repeat-containing protein, partial [Thermoproteota archaeon]
YFKPIDYSDWVFADGKEFSVTVVSIYSYTISVSGLESYSTDIYLDGAWKASLKNGESFTFAGLSGTHTISVSEVVSISSGVRLFCSRPSITVSSSGSYTFQYKKQYYLSVSVKPSDSGTISRGSGWYDAGTTLTITATPNSGYQFREWFGDVSSSADTITITMDRPMEITAWFGKQNVISCKLSQTVITRLNTLKISGSIYPSPGYPVDVKVNFILPSGSTKVITTSTDYNGNYEVSFTPDVKGTWQVYASWDGDESFSPSKSETTSFTVTPIIYSFSIDSNFKLSNIFLLVDGEKISTYDLPKIYRFEEFTSHSIHVENEYYEQEGIRYLFVSWSDSDKKELDRSFTIDRDISIKAIFIKQYYLKIISNFGSAEGEGWYDEGSYAYARLDKDEFPAEDIFHVYRFVHWSRDASGSRLTSDPIMMNSPKVAVAVWEKRFSLLFYLVVIGSIITATMIPMFYSKNIRTKVFNRINSLIKAKEKPVLSGEGTTVKELPFTKEHIEKVVKDIEDCVKRYRSYIEKSESMHKEGKISDSVFERLKDEYNSKIEELNKLKEQIKKEGKISESNYSRLKDLGLIKEN